MSFEAQLHTSILRRSEEKCRQRLPLKATSAGAGRSRPITKPYEHPLPKVTSIDPIAQLESPTSSHDFRQRAERKLTFALENSYTNKTRQNHSYAKAMRARNVR